jgi:hypothetical protein
LLAAARHLPLLEFAQLTGKQVVALLAPAALLGELEPLEVQLVGGDGHENSERRPGADVRPG